MLKDLRIDHLKDGFYEFLARDHRGIMTGLQEFDDQLLGLPGMTTLRGDPKAGKSMLVTQMVVHILSSGIPVYHVDRENGVNELQLRALANLSKVPREVIRSGEYNEKERKVLREVSDKLYGLDWYINTRAESTTRDQIKQDVTALLSSHDKVMMVVDSLHSMPALDSDPNHNVTLWLQFLEDFKKDNEGKLYIVSISEKLKAAFNDQTARLGSGAGTRKLDYAGDLILELKFNPETKIRSLHCIGNRHGECFFRVCQFGKPVPEKFCCKFETVRKF
jgi:replicative DNA helicase